MPQPTTPWWEAVRLREEIVSASGTVGDVQMSLYNAVHGVGGTKAPYAAPRYYGEITYPSSSLIELMAKVAVRLGVPGSSGIAPALWRLDQGMGGGKSHGLIGLWHLASHPSDLARTDVGEKLFAVAEKIAGKGNVAPDLNQPVVVVLSCDNMTPGKGDRDLDGPAQTLGERFLWRLFEETPRLYKQYRDHTGNKAKLAEALKAVGRPVLILVDEILDYVRKAAASNIDGLVEDDMAFLRALFDTIKTVPNCVMVVVMIASEKDQIVLNLLGEKCRSEINALFTRNGTPATVTAATDFAEIIRRRLFEAPPPADAVRLTARRYLDRMEMSGAWGRQIFNRLLWASPADFEAAVQRCFPFHPALIHLAENEWSLATGFQRVRSTIQIFAATVWAHQQRADRGEWVPILIGPGDLPLSEPPVREALLNSGLIEDQRTVANYREIAATEVVSDDDQKGTARMLDLRRQDPAFQSANPRAAERAATALFVYSIGQRPQGQRGATEPEIEAATFVPDLSFAVGDADAIVRELQSPDTGLAALERREGKGGQPARLLLSTRQTLNMFFRAQRNWISDDESDAELAAAAWSLATTGPFTRKVPVLVEAGQSPLPLRDIVETAGIDDARSTRLVVLDPCRFSLLNGDDETRDAVRAALGIGPDKLAVGWASSAVFAVVDAQRRSQARNLAATHLAWKRVADIEAVRADEELTTKAQAAVDEASKRFHTAVKSAYHHVIYLAENGDGERTDTTIRLDKEGQSALDGSIVWTVLCGADKAFARGEFDIKALLHNLREEDYGRPLSEVRDAFWNSPRLPLLPDGETELRDILYQAVERGELRLVDKDGVERKANNAYDINPGSSHLRLSKPGTTATDSVEVPNVVGKHRGAAREALETAGLRLAGDGDGIAATQSPTPGDKVARGASVQVSFVPGPSPASDREHQVSIALNTSLADDDKRDSVRLLLSALANAVDDGASHIQLGVALLRVAECAGCGLVGVRGSEQEGLLAATFLVV